MLFKNAFFRYCILCLPIAQWLRSRAKNWKIVGSIPAGVIGIFH